MEGKMFTQQSEKEALKETANAFNCSGNRQMEIQYPKLLLVQRRQLMCQQANGDMVSQTIFGISNNMVCCTCILP